MTQHNYGYAGERLVSIYMNVFVGENVQKDNC